MAKIADDLSSHYVLGYYTNNTRWDGGAAETDRQAEVDRQTISARREYRAPTEEEMSAIRNARSASPAAAPSAGQAALSALSRVSPSSRLNAYGTVDRARRRRSSRRSPPRRSRAGGGSRGRTSRCSSHRKTAAGHAQGKIEPLMRGTLVRAPTGAPGPGRLSSASGEDNVADSDTVSMERAGDAARQAARLSCGVGRGLGLPSACGVPVPPHRARPHRMAGAAAVESHRRGCSIAPANRWPFR